LENHFLWPELLKHILIYAVGLGQLAETWGTQSYDDGPSPSSAQCRDERVLKRESLWKAFGAREWLLKGLACREHAMGARCADSLA
jgi:hypothetical protein